MSEEITTGDRRLLFSYWGRRGLSRLTFELMYTATQNFSAPPFLSVSRANEQYDQFVEAFGQRVIGVGTFKTNSGAITKIWRTPSLRHKLVRAIRDKGVTTVVDLMPHIWSSVMISAARKSGVDYIAVAHDAHTHPGDYRTSAAKYFTDQTLRRADHVIALSSCVADSLFELKIQPRTNITTLFHPDISYSRPPKNGYPLPTSRPLRIAFLGRILPYKGLPLFVDTIEELRRRGLRIECGVFGEGTIGPELDRLTSLNAEVVNHWLSDAEIADLLTRYDIIAATHLEASQSGVVATTMGAARPVVATPVGGLTEQVTDGDTGILAKEINANALADAVSRLVSTPGLYQQISSNIIAHSDMRSVNRFLHDCVATAQRKQTAID